MFSMPSSLKLLVAAVALVATPTVSGAQACQGARCVLPLPAPAAPPVVITPEPVSSVPVEAVAVETVRRGISPLVLLLGAAALAGLLFLLLNSSGNDDDDVEAPTSP